MGNTVLGGRPCYVLGLKPKRKEKELVSGSAWVDKSSLLILHIEGEIAKAPSWWLKSVRIKMSFGDLSGAWLQTCMEAIADARLLGFHTLRSRVLDYRGSDMSASIKLVPTSTRLRSGDDYMVDLLDVTVMELEIVPDKGGGEALASLIRLRLG